MVTRKVGKTNDRRKDALSRLEKNLKEPTLNKRLEKLIANGKLTKEEALKRQKDRIEKEIATLKERVLRGR